jgi:rhodanese-related sulfurtransferase
MTYIRIFTLLLIVPLVFSLQACTDSTTAPEPINEAQVLLEYLESNGDYINTSAPSIVSASDVRTTMLSNPSAQYIIDMRASADFTAGRIEGSVNVTMANLLTHIKSLPNAASYTRIVINCYSGQTAAYAASLLRLMGYSNVFSLKWGMSSWDSTFAQNYWLTKMSNSRASQFTTAATPKDAAGSLPTISTGKTSGAEILEARVNALLTVGYAPATIDNGTLFTNLSGYYIVNYWPLSQYNNPGHIPGAIHYEPKQDLKSLTYLKTLPTNKPSVFYCYTGQTSSFLAAYLRLLGYDARSLLYGANAMIYDQMPANKFLPSTEIKGYPYVAGP